MVEGGMSCIKYLMFVFNFVFVVCGIALIVVGAVVQGRDYTMFLDSKYVTAPTILIVVGVFIFLLAFLGCYGAIRENHCMVTTFGIILFLIFIVELAGGISAYVYRNEFEGFLKKNMNSTLAQDKDDSRKIWDEMQSKWHCCGVEGAQDYTENNLKVPKSCCDPKEDTCEESKAFPKGCFKQMLDKLNHAIAVVGGVAVGIAVIELIGVMFSWCLASAIKKEYEGV